MPIFAGESIPESDARRWRQWQARRFAIRNPLLSPEFVRCAAEVRPGVEVLRWDCDGEPTGYLAFHRDESNIASSIAGSFSDVEGIVADENAPPLLGRLIEDAELSAWTFQHLVDGDCTATCGSWGAATSNYIQLANGFQEYCAERRRQTKEVQEGLRKSRKLARDHGRLRLEADETDVAALRQLVAWKREQIASRGWADCFTPSWVLPLLDRVFAERGESFRGRLSALYVGDDLAAITLGMQAHGVLHGWVTAYSARYHPYSPGRILILLLAQRCKELGVDRIDMGPGDELFKKSLASGGYDVHRSGMDRVWTRRVIREACVRITDRIRRSPIHAPAQWLFRRLRRCRRSLTTMR